MSSSDIVGLEFTNGNIWYCPRSVLTNATGSYFSTRFGTDAMIPAGSERSDQHGRTIYFVSRDGTLFGNYILPFLLTSRPGKLPPFSKDPELWQLLREEADFYGLDGLSDLLHVTNTFIPDGNNDKGVLYWLGTNKGTRDYQNPYECGQVNVTGWMDCTKEELDVLRREKYSAEYAPKVLASLPKTRSVLVQHRPPVKGVSSGNKMLSARDTSYLLWCDHDLFLQPVVIDLKSITLNLTAYSFRRDSKCNDMTDWNVEGSTNGIAWEKIHYARDQSVAYASQKEIQELTSLVGCEDYDPEDVPNEKELDEFLLSYAERKHRHLFYVDQQDTGRFYRYIRFTGAMNGSGSCSHAVAVELFGDVHID